MSQPLLEQLKPCPIHFTARLPILFIFPFIRSKPLTFNNISMERSTLVIVLFSWHPSQNYYFLHRLHQHIYLTVFFDEMIPGDFSEYLRILV